MKEADAVEMLANLEFWVQKSRSNIKEIMGVDDEDADTLDAKIMRDMHPWLFGAGSILMPLVKLNRQIREGRPLEAMEFYNFCVIVSRTPVLGISSLMRHDKPYEFPEPSLSIISQWEPTVAPEQQELDMTDPGQMMAWYQKHKKESNDEDES